jgi:hypothetical protein
MHKRKRWGRWWAISLSLVILLVYTVIVRFNNEVALKYEVTDVRAAGGMYGPRDTSHLVAVEEDVRAWTSRAQAATAVVSLILLIMALKGIYDWTMIYRESRRLEDATSGG